MVFKVLRINPQNTTDQNHENMILLKRVQSLQLQSNLDSFHINLFE